MLQCDRSSCYTCTVIFSKKWSYKKRYRITPFLKLKVTPLVVLKCDTTFGAILTPPFMELKYNTKSGVKEI